MKKLFIIVFILFIGLNVSAEPTAELNEAKSKLEIQKWADNSSFGSIYNEFNYNEKEVFVVIRSFTSGRLSADCTVFIKYDKKWLKVLKREVLLGETIIVKEKNGNLEFKTDQNRLLMLIPIEGLYDGPIGRKIVTEPAH